MARNITVEQFEQRCRVAMDLENDDNKSSADFLLFLNAHYPDYWDLLIENGPPNLLDEKTTFTTTAGEDEYDLDTICQDDDDEPNFYKLTGIFVLSSSGVHYPLNRFQDTNMSAWQPNVVAGVTVKIHYTPLCPRLTAPTDTIRCYNGWDELLVQRVCAEVKKAREEDWSAFETAYNRERTRVKRMVDPDRWAPQTILRREGALPRLGGNGPDAYILRGNNLELVNCRAWSDDY